MRVSKGFLLKAICVIVLLESISPIAFAHQPVMDMAPRWKGGYGFQVRNEYVSSEALKVGDSKVANPSGRRKRINTTWLEGVFTFKRGLRLTVKMPFVDQIQTTLQNGLPVIQGGRGLGDAIIGLQLKRYYNAKSSTGNFGMTPSLRIPTGSTKDDYPVGDGSVDVGLSLSFSAEMAWLYQFYDLFYWNNAKGSRGIDRGNELGFDMNVGIHPYHSNATNTGIFLMLDLSARKEALGQSTSGVTGGDRVSLGPVFVLYRNNIMFRSELKIPAFEDVKGTQISRGTEFNIGTGVTF